MLLRPGETDPSHPKYSVLRPDDQEYPPNEKNRERPG
jgi:hypothetical protein